MGGVLLAGRAQQRCLWRLLVHGLPSRNVADRRGAEPCREAAASPGWPGTCGARLRRRRLRGLVPIRRTRRGPEDQEPRCLRKEAWRPRPTGESRFLYNGALSTYEKLGFSRDRKIAKNRWVVTRLIEPSS